MRSGTGSTAAPAARWWVFAIPAVLYAVLWLPRLLRTPVWNDEMATLLFAALSPGELWQATGHVDRSHVVYYALVAPLGHLDHALYYIRGVSWLSMASALGFTGLIAYRFWGRLGLALTTAFCVLNPILAGYGIEARAYAIGVLCFACASWLLMRGLDSGHFNVRRLMLYAAALAIMSALNFLLLAQLIAHLPALYFARPHDRARVVAAWTPALLIAGVMAWGASQQSGQLTWLKAPTLVETLWGIVLLGGSSYVHFFVVLAIVLVAPLVLWRNGSAQDRFAGLTMWLWYVGPMAGLAVLSHLISPVAYYRYVLPSALAAGLLTAGTVVVALRGRRRAGLAVASVVGVALIAGGLLSPLRTSPPREADRLAALVKKDAQVGDVLAVDQSYELTGQLAMVGHALNDGTIAERAQQKVLTGPTGWEFFRVVSTSPWRTTPVPAPSGRVLELRPDWIERPLTGCRDRERVGVEERTLVTRCRH